MAKTCQINREAKRKQLADRLGARREELKKQIIDPNIDEDVRREAVFKLQKLPRDSAKVRYTRRCKRTGVSRAVYRKFELNRISFRDLALEGMLPGVTKASW